MSRLPYPEEVTVADAIAFESFTPEQKRIAIAGVAIHEYMKDRIEEAEDAVKGEAYDTGFAARSAQVNEALHHAIDKLTTFQQFFTPADTRHGTVVEIITDLTKLVL